jgi:transcription elongation factor Elf1
MFLIFGIKRRAHRLATAFALCGHCGTPAAQVVTRRTTWFALFFVPVIPLGTTYVVTCTFCGASTKIDKDRALQMVTSAEQPAAPSPSLPAPGAEGQTQALPPPVPPPAPPLGP